MADAPGRYGDVEPHELNAPAEDAEAYVKWRTATDLRAPYRVTPELLKGTRKDLGPEFDRGQTPLIVFINARSGGRVGPRLAQVLSRAIGTSQGGWRPAPLSRG
ncbi:hypothetical protein MNEG_12327 [Monoraphidium neglectum]|uniref:Uncharacterized protein n=1 Tax=Monoraphidium neglectum TaxID=145388 RepID=A0A0D2M2U2_9CHLO|nr:hypothetical protein MNEG_12327 [Monoraphidium neglectum]KIY95636.1 hypothetical protein MNEG_12327 [Monoraphidium neglectum]|eukprot:XP_013894656.1 hypothetical protein MNEG_12327 [Monoraphidium neglectum]